MRTFLLGLIIGATLAYGVSISAQDPRPMPPLATTVQDWQLHVEDQMRRIRLDLADISHGTCPNKKLCDPQQ